MVTLLKIHINRVKEDCMRVKYYQKCFTARPLAVISLFDDWLEPSLGVNRLFNVIPVCNRYNMT